MLVVHQGHSLDEKIARLRARGSVADLESTWLVADLKSKSEMQKILLERTRCLPEDAIIRVSEFWQKLFHRLTPEFELVSSSLVTTTLTEWLSARDLAWAAHPNTAKLLVEYIDFFLPILARRDLVERSREWLRQNSSALIRWGAWFELAVEAWQYLALQKTVARGWAAGYLAALETGEWPWQRPLVFDLGADLTGVEAELILQLAKSGLNIEVYAPDRAMREEFSETLWPYSVLLSEAIGGDCALAPAPIFGSYAARPCISRRLTSPLAEVKAATAAVRAALEAGLAANEIAVFAAQIEDYWPQLEAYLRVEGVPVAKNTVLTGVSLPAAARWLARLRVEAQNISSGDLEHALFGDVGCEAGRDLPMSYEKFAPLYNKIYEVDDLERQAEVRRRFALQFAANERLGRDQFFDWAIKFWQGPSAGADKIVAAIFQECPQALRLELRSWIRYVETLLPKIEVTVLEGASGGVHVGNFASGAHLKLKKIILLGLSERALVERSEISVSHGDVMKIAADLGVNLRQLDVRAGSFWVEHLLRQCGEKAELYFAATNLAGEPQTPSLVWLERATDKNTDKSLEICEAPALARWDEIQYSILTDDSDAYAELKKLARQDLGLEPAEPSKNNFSFHYSISQIENYLECPFIFTAQKLLRLSDTPDVDLDVDQMTRGRLLHAALDRVLATATTAMAATTATKWQWSHEELAALVDGLRDQLGVVLGFKDLWPTQRERYIEIIERFLTFEKEWRHVYGATHTVGREMQIRGELRLNDTMTIAVTGKIDRVDTNTNGELAVLDYKSSGAGLRNYSSWLENDELQLLFYSLCLEEGLAEGLRGPVIGAFYFILSNMSREKGFRDGGRVGSLFGEAGRTRTALDREELLNLYKELKEKIAGVVSRIAAGELGPQPKGIEFCATCAWKTTCRAPHLN